MFRRRISSLIPPRGSFERRLLRIATCIVTVPLVLAALGIAGLWLWKYGQVRRELARIAAAGEPVTVEDWSRMYRLPPEVEDDTPRWQEAVTPLQRLDMLDAQLFDALPFVGRASEPPPPGRPWPQMQQAEALLKQYAGALKLLHEANAAAGAPRFAMDFTQGWRMELPHIMGMRNGARLLRLQAHVRAHRGDLRATTDSLRAVFAVGRALEHEPMLVSHYTRLTCESSAREEIRALLPVVDFSDEQLAGFQTLLREPGYELGLHRAMLGERVLYSHLFQHPPSTDEIAQMGYERRAAFLWKLWKWDDYLFCLGVMGKMVDLSEPKAIWLPALREAEHISTQGSSIEGRPYLVTAMFLGGVGTWLHPTPRGTAVNRAADAAIAVWRYRRRDESMPRTLDELVPDLLPEVPIDPYDGKPLRYVVRQGEYVVYSVGANGIDDGGRGDESGDPDVVFAVTLP